MLTDNDSGAALLSLTAAGPGDTDTSCITVTYTGSLASSVRLHGATGGSGLADNLDLIVTRGSGAGGVRRLRRVHPRRDRLHRRRRRGGLLRHAHRLPRYLRHGTRRPHRGRTGVVDQPRVAPVPDRLVVTVQDANAAQGRDATQTFTWEARNT